MMTTTIQPYPQAQKMAHQFRPRLVLPTLKSTYESQPSILDKDLIWQAHEQILLEDRIPKYLNTLRANPEFGRSFFHQAERAINGYFSIVDGIHLTKRLREWGISYENCQNLQEVQDVATLQRYFLDTRNLDGLHVVDTVKGEIGSVEQVMPLFQDLMRQGEGAIHEFVRARIPITYLAAHAQLASQVAGSKLRAALLICHYCGEGNVQANILKEGAVTSPDNIGSAIRVKNYGVAQDCIVSLKPHSPRHNPWDDKSNIVINRHVIHYDPILKVRQVNQLPQEHYTVKDYLTRFG